MTYTLGAQPSPLDKRDWVVSTIYPKEIAISGKVDLRGRLGPVRNQGSVGSCVAQAQAASQECHEYDDAFNDSIRQLSVAHNYIQRSNYPSSGMYPRDSYDIILKTGIPYEYQFDYSYINGNKNDISSFITEKAKDHKILGYARVETLDEVKKTLEKNQPVMISVPVYNYGIRMWHKESSTDTIIGGHAMLIVGYDNNKVIDGNKGAFIIRNSWGKDWGVENGHCYFPYVDWGKQWECWCSVDADSTKPDKWYKWKRFWYNVKNWFKKYWFIVIAVSVMTIFLIIGIISNKNEEIETSNIVIENLIDSNL